MQSPRWRSIALIGAAICVLFTACAPVNMPTAAMTSSTSNAKTAEQSRELRVGDPAPDFALPDQNRQDVRLSSFRGKTVQVAFYVWALSPG
jgi:hypothetical protein